MMKHLTDMFQLNWTSSTRFLDSFSVFLYIHRWPLWYFHSSLLIWSSLCEPLGVGDPQSSTASFPLKIDGKGRQAGFLLGLIVTFSGENSLLNFQGGGFLMFGCLPCNCILFVLSWRGCSMVCEGEGRASLWYFESLHHAFKKMQLLFSLIWNHIYIYYICSQRDAFDMRIFRYCNKASKKAILPSFHLSMQQSTEMAMSSASGEQVEAAMFLRCKALSQHLFMVKFMWAVSKTLVLCCV